MKGVPTVLSLYDQYGNIDKFPSLNKQSEIPVITDMINMKDKYPDFKIPNGNVIGYILNEPADLKQKLVEVRIKANRIDGRGPNIVLLNSVENDYSLTDQLQNLHVKSSGKRPYGRDSENNQVVDDFIDLIGMEALKGYKKRGIWVPDNWLTDGVYGAAGGFLVVELIQAFMPSTSGLSPHLISLMLSPLGFAYGAYGAHVLGPKSEIKKSEVDTIVMDRASDLEKEIKLVA